MNLLHLSTNFSPLEDFIGLVGPFAAAISKSYSNYRDAVQLHEFEVVFLEQICTLRMMSLISAITSSKGGRRFPARSSQQIRLLELFSTYKIQSTL